MSKVIVCIACLALAGCSGGWQAATAVLNLIGPLDTDHHGQTSRLVCNTDVVTDPTTQCHSEVIGAP